jgi:CRP-like cAMP-binding protein
MTETDDDFAFFRALPELGEADVEALIEIATLDTIPPRTELTVEGSMPRRLCFVIEGEMLLEKAGRIRRIGPGIFVGETAFVLDDVASATVTLDKGGRVVSWDIEELRSLLSGNANLAAGFDTAFKQDLARKVASS